MRRIFTILLWVLGSSVYANGVFIGGLKFDPSVPTESVWNSDPNTRPDYMRQLSMRIETRFNYSSNNIFAEFGTFDFSSDEMYELDGYIRSFLDPLLAKHFPNLFNNYDLVFLNSSHPTMIQIKNDRSDQKKTPPIVYLTRDVTDRAESIDEVIWAIVHECLHQLRFWLAPDSWYDRILKQLAEETSVADIKSARILVEGRLNPQASSLLLEKFLKAAVLGRRSNFDNLTEGFSSHPPTEIRVTQLNATIEQMAERYDLPELTPLHPLLVRAQSEPRPTPGLPELEYQMATAVDFPNQLQSIANNLRQKEMTAKQVIKILKKEFQIIRDRRAWDLRHTSAREIAWDQTAGALQSIWGTLPDHIAENREVIAVFQEEEKNLVALAKSEGKELRTYDAEYLDLNSALIGVRSKEDLLELKKLFDAQTERLAQRIGSQSRTARGVLLRQRYETPTYSFRADLDSLEKAFENYIALSPKLFDWAEEAIRDPSVVDPNSDASMMLNVIIDMRDELLAQLYGYNRMKCFDKSDTKYPSYNRFKIALAAFNLKIAALPIPAFAKFALFPCVEFHDSDRTRGTKHYELEWVNGQPSKNTLFPSALGFLTQPRTELPQFASFHHALRFIYFMQREREGADLQFLTRDHVRFSHRYLLGFEGNEDWFQSTLASYALSLGDAEALLDDPYFWEFGENTINSHVSAWRPETFYGRAEYKIDPAYAQSIQVLVYRKMKSSKYLPTELKDQIELWKKFAKRGVSEFTDEWAEYILSEALRRNDTELVEFIYASELVWDLRLREQMALHLLSPNQSGRVVEIQGRAPAVVFSLITRFSELSGKLGVETQDAKRHGTSEDEIRTTTQAGLQSALLTYGKNPEQLKEILDRQINNVGAGVGGGLGALRQECREMRSLARKIRIGVRNSRIPLIGNLLVEIEQKFPEKSQEKEAVIDRLAHDIRANRAETDWIMQHSSGDRDAIRDLSIGRVEALGFRFFSQLFGELKVAKIEERLELLDFLLGKREKPPLLLTEGLLKVELDESSDDERREKYRSVEDRLSPKSREQLRENLFNGVALKGIRTVIGPYRARKFFQSLTPATRAVVIDPLFVGNEGIPATPLGKQWIAETLVPEGASWKQMAIDLTEGYIKGLEIHKSAHLRTLFLSYLVGTQAKPRSSKFQADFGEVTRPLEEEIEVQEGKVLKTLFEVNAALTKIGQRVHSSNLLSPRTNDALGSLKEDVSKVLRESLFHWLENASNCSAAICDRTEIIDVLGNASIKVVMDLKIDDQEGVLYLVKPNALRRGLDFFKVIEHAVRFAMSKGHDQLRLILPIIQRSAETFENEIDMKHEREAARKIASLYGTNRTYGNGYRFITPEEIELPPGTLKESNAYLVKKMNVKRLSEISKGEMSEIANAISLKEKEISISESTGADPDEAEDILFEKDRHEGNFVKVVDPALERKYGVGKGKLILVLDPAQVSKISRAQRSAIFDALGIVSSFQIGATDLQNASQRLRALIVEKIAVHGTSQEALSRIEEFLQQPHERDPGELLSNVLAHLEAEGTKVSPDVWDYLTMVNTNQTWRKYNETDPFHIALEGQVKARVLREVGQLPIAQQCAIFMRRMSAQRPEIPGRKPRTKP